jgi:hypothetical protein
MADFWKQEEVLKLRTLEIDVTINGVSCSPIFIPLLLMQFFGG